MPETISHHEEESRPTVEARQLFEFEEGGLRGEWLRLETQDGKGVEGALYKPTPENDNGEVIIFHPGMPGGAIGPFEEGYVQSLLDEGYEVFAARHNGLMMQENNENLYHNQHRLDYGEDTTGSALTWFTEPEASISYFTEQGKPITLVTHSFSGITASNSFIEMAKKGDQNPAKNVKKWVLLSSSIWDIGEDGALDPDRGLDLDKLRQYCEYFASKYSTEEGGAERLFELLKSTLEKITENIGSSVPETTEVIGIYPTEDKLVSHGIGTAFIDKLPRGVVIRDHHTPSEESEDPHDYAHARAQDLLRIIKMHTSGVKHTFDINQ